jgi:catechol 2,3-dioxygenase-like lactoylglutathione lyase family enzyme
MTVLFVALATAPPSSREGGSNPADSSGTRDLDIASGSAGVARPLQIGHHGRVEEAIPILRVGDAETSVAWYERLGFEKEWEHRFEPAFPAFVSLARHGSSRLFLSEHSADAGGPLVAGTVVYLRVDDVDTLATQFDAEIVEMPWAREVWLTDPDGNRLRIGTPSP